MSKYSEYAVGDKVVIVDINKIQDGHEYWNQGDETVVTDVWGSGMLKLRPTVENCPTTGNYLKVNELDAIAKVSSTESKSIDAILLEKINSLEHRVSYLEGVILTSGQSYEEAENKEAHKPPTANQLRKVLIQESVDILEPYKDNPNVIFNVNRPFGFVICCVIKETTGEIASSKIHIKENEVFNKNIYKAYVLEKALGNNVDKYENMTQPNDWVLGMDIEMYYEVDGSTENFTIAEFLADGIKFSCGEWEDYDYLEKHGKIVDDTNAQY